MSRTFFEEFLSVARNPFQSPFRLFHQSVAVYSASLPGVIRSNQPAGGPDLRRYNVVAAESVRRFPNRCSLMKGNLVADSSITREKLIAALNDDLAREYQAIIAYINYSQVLKGAQYMSIAKELEVHAGEELSHALQIAKQIDYLGGMPTVVPKPVRTSEKPEDMLRFDLENEMDTIGNYRARIRQADALGEYAMCEVLRQIIAQEQEHAIDLATALGIEVPPIPKVDA
jgi:bacterioferritin